MSSFPPFCADKTLTVAWVGIVSSVYCTVNKQREVIVSRPIMPSWSLSTGVQGGKQCAGRPHEQPLPISRCALYCLGLGKGWCGHASSAGD